MSKYNGPRVPLHMQNPGIAKAAAKTSPSYESFAPHQQHTSQYREMDDRPSTHAMSRIRRYTDGRLDYLWALNTIKDAIEKAELGAPLTPLEESMLTAVFPIKFPKTEANLAEIRTQLSKTEKAYLKELAEAQFSEELNWNAGRGGGSAPGRSRTIVGKG